MRTHQYSAFQRHDSLSGISGNGSTWRGFWKKLGRLLPYMWPTNAPQLQLRVIFCIFLLVGRLGYVRRGVGLATVYSILPVSI